MQPAIIIAWAITAIAFGVTITVVNIRPELVQTPAVIAQTTTNDPVPALKAEIATLLRNLDDAQSALGDRDREIANAMAELAARPTITATTDITAYIRGLQQRGIKADLLKDRDKVLGGIIIGNHHVGLLLFAQAPPTPVTGQPPISLWVERDQQPIERLAVCHDLFLTFTLPNTWEPGYSLSLRADEGAKAGAIIATTQLLAPVEPNSK